MTNHLHLLMTPQKDHGISQMMQALGRQCVRFDTSVLNAIRTSVSKGLALGDNRFKLQIEENYKRRVTPRTAGRKPK